MYESLSLFSEPTKMWFEHAFGQPTEAQAQAWPAIHSGRNVLVIALPVPVKHWPRFSQPSTD